jgi:hypothetical protein
MDWGEDQLRRCFSEVNVDSNDKKGGNKMKKTLNLVSLLLAVLMLFGSAKADTIVLTATLTGSQECHRLVHQVSAVH